MTGEHTKWRAAAVASKKQLPTTGWPLQALGGLPLNCLTPFRLPPHAALPSHSQNTQSHSQNTQQGTHALKRVPFSPPIAMLPSSPLQTPSPRDLSSPFVQELEEVLESLNPSYCPASRQHTPDEWMETLQHGGWGPL